MDPSVNFPYFGNSNLIQLPYQDGLFGLHISTQMRGPIACPGIGRAKDFTDDTEREIRRWRQSAGHSMAHYTEARRSVGLESYTPNEPRLMRAMLPNEACNFFLYNSQSLMGLIGEPGPPKLGLLWGTEY